MEFRKWERRIEKISGEEYRPRLFSLEQLLVGISWVYGWVSKLRLRAYEFGLLGQKKLPVPVISIGNIQVGGTGKTPMAQYMAALLKDMGKFPVVISRGYKGEASGEGGIVGDGSQVFLGPDQAGDEPHMMAMGKSFPVVVGRDRFRAGCLALEHLSVVSVILDDGFQHLSLGRDLDLLLLDHDRPFGNGRILPAGRLREGGDTAEKRADAIILTRCPHPWGKGVDADISKVFPNTPIFNTRHRPVIAHWQEGGREVKRDISSLGGTSALIISGIARNDSFRKSVESLGVTIIDHLEFQDHYGYKKSDYQLICRTLDDHAGARLITTQKDWEKLRCLGEPRGEWIALGIEMEFESPREFRDFIRLRLNP